MLSEYSCVCVCVSIYNFCNVMKWEKESASSMPYIHDVVLYQMILGIMNIFSLTMPGEYKKDELLEAARSGNEEQMMALLTPLNVNCHASDGRKVGTLVATSFARGQF